MRWLLLFLLMIGPALAEPYLVNGIALGSSRQEVFQRLGAPTSKSNESLLEVWKYQDWEVGFDGGGSVKRIYGTLLEEDSHTLARVGELTSLVRRRLGEPADLNSLGIQPHPEVDLMMYVRGATLVAVFSREGRVSLVGVQAR